MAEQCTGHEAHEEQSQAFWDKTFEEIRQSYDITGLTPDECVSALDREFWRLLGDLRGLDVLEIGCGIGNDTVQYVRRGARLTSIDLSSVAVDCARERLAAMGLPADLHVMSACDIGALNRQFDVIVGRFVLHHLEPFAEIAALFSSCLKPDGRMVFVENNARNPFLMLARKHLAGHFGIPRYGDDLEFPLTPEEVESMRPSFGEVACSFPSMVFVRKLNTYVFRQKALFRPVMRSLDWVDDTLWRVFPSLRKYSYNQIVAASRPLLEPAAGAAMQVSMPPVAAQRQRVNA